MMVIAGDGAPWLLHPFSVTGNRSDFEDFNLGNLAIRPTAALSQFLDGSKLSLRVPTEADSAALDAAGERIAWVPDLLSVVWDHVGAIGLLDSNNDDYDQSHSAPELGSTILVSVPLGRCFAELRVAESVIHEAMHLRLSALEASVPIVSTSGLLYSPWRDTVRPVDGVLHGLYVFACLQQFFLRVAACYQARADEIEHAKIRAHQIEQEISAVDMLALIGHLTREGVNLIECLI